MQQISPNSQPPEQNPTASQSFNLHQRGFGLGYPGEALTVTDFSSTASSLSTYPVSDSKVISFIKSICTEGSVTFPNLTVEMAHSESLFRATNAHLAKLDPTNNRIIVCHQFERILNDGVLTELFRKTVRAFLYDYNEFGRTLSVELNREFQRFQVDPRQPGLQRDLPSNMGFFAKVGPNCPDRDHQDQALPIISLKIKQYFATPVEPIVQISSTVLSPLFVDSRNVISVHPIVTTLSGDQLDALLRYGGSLTRHTNSYPQTDSVTSVCYAYPHVIIELMDDSIFQKNLRAAFAKLHKGGLECKAQIELLSRIRKSSSDKALGQNAKFELAVNILRTQVDGTILTARQTSDKEDLSTAPLLLRLVTSEHFGTQRSNVFSANKRFDIIDARYKEVFEAGRSARTERKELNRRINQIEDELHRSRTVSNAIQRYKVSWPIKLVEAIELYHRQLATYSLTKLAPKELDQFLNSLNLAEADEIKAKEVYLGFKESESREIGRYAKLTMAEVKYIKAKVNALRDLSLISTALPAKDRESQNLVDALGNASRLKREAYAVYREKQRHAVELRRKFKEIETDDSRRAKAKSRFLEKLSDSIRKGRRLLSFEPQVLTSERQDFLEAQLSSLTERLLVVNTTNVDHDNEFDEVSDLRRKAMQKLQVARADLPQFLVSSGLIAANGFAKILLKSPTSNTDRETSIGLREVLKAFRNLEDRALTTIRGLVPLLSSKTHAHEIFMRMIISQLLGSHERKTIEEVNALHTTEVQEALQESFINGVFGRSAGVIFSAINNNETLRENFRTELGTLYKYLQPELIADNFPGPLHWREVGFTSPLGAVIGTTMSVLLRSRVPPGLGHGPTEQLIRRFGITLLAHADRDPGLLRGLSKEHLAQLEKVLFDVMPKKGLSPESHELQAAALTFLQITSSSPILNRALSVMRTHVSKLVCNETIESESLRMHAERCLKTLVRYSQNAVLGELFEESLNSFCHTISPSKFLELWKDIYPSIRSESSDLNLLEALTSPQFRGSSDSVTLNLFGMVSDQVLSKFLESRSQTLEELNRTVLRFPTGVASKLIRYLPIAQVRELFKDLPPERASAFLDNLDRSTYPQIATGLKSGRAILFRRTYRDSEPDRGSEFVEDPISGEIVPNYFYYLGIPRDSTLDIIKKSHRYLVWCLHPDRHGGESEATKAEDAKLFQIIMDGYEILEAQETLVQSERNVSQPIVVTPTNKGEVIHLSSSTQLMTTRPSLPPAATVKTNYLAQLPNHADLYPTKPWFVDLPELGESEWSD